MKKILIIAACFLSCEQAITPTELVEKSIAAHGLIGNHNIEFEFRGKLYDVLRKNGEFEYKRIYNDTIDILNNDGFTRSTNNKFLSISVKDSNYLSATLNSVIYFSFLPLPLLDEAVHLALLENESIKKESYYKLEVTFSEENGGTDFEDRFLYWINKRTFLIDYMAYSYTVNGGGSRFRAVSNRHKMGDMILSDFDNYKFSDKNTKIDDYVSFLAKDSLIKVSEINLINPQMKSFSKN